MRSFSILAVIIVAIVLFIYIVGYIITVKAPEFSSELATSTLDQLFTDTHTQKIVILSTSEKVIPAILAQTPVELSQGLSGRESLPMDQGMLFAFPQPGNHGFWMKEMRFPIDIIWLGEDKVVKGVTASITPDTYPTIFYPPSPVRYVLELNAGQNIKMGLAIGTKIDFDLNK